MFDKIIKNCDLNETSTVFNVGANEGQELKKLVKIGCEVHAFEPHPIFYSELLNEYGSYENIHIHNKAAWHSDGEAFLYFKRSQHARNGGSSLRSDKTNINRKLKTKVKTIDIANYIMNLNKKIDLFWMDVEGSEYDILEHLYDRDAYRKINNIFFEDHLRKIPANRIPFFGKLFTGMNDYRKSMKIVNEKFKKSGIVFEVTPDGSHHYAHNLISRP